MATKTFQNLYEKQVIEKRIQGFQIDNSKALKLLFSLYQKTPVHQELLSLAQIISENLQINLDREATRRKIVLFKWYEEHIDQIEPFLRNNVMVIDGKGMKYGLNNLPKEKS